MNGLLWVEQIESMLNISNGEYIRTIYLKTSEINLDNFLKKYNINNLIIAYSGLSTKLFSTQNSKNIIIDTDINVLSNILLLENEMLAILNTGSSLAIRKNGIITRFGGYGYLLDDQGSNYLLAKTLIKKYITLKELNKTNTFTAYVEQILSIEKFDATNLIYKIYNDNPKFLIQFANNFITYNDEIYNDIIAQFCEDMLDYITSTAHINNIKHIKVIGRVLSNVSVNNNLKQIHGLELLDPSLLIYENYNHN